MKKFAIIIHTNDSQEIGARISEFSFSKDRTNLFDIHILNVARTPVEKIFGGTIKRNGIDWSLKRNDLQSFTIARFYAAKQYNSYKRILVIDPDIFYVGNNIDRIFNLNLRGKPIAAVYSDKRRGWESSAMLVDVDLFLKKHDQNWAQLLREHKLDYTELMSLNYFSKSDVHDLSAVWNSMDALNHDTELLHTTNRITQPWKTGLFLEFNRFPVNSIRYKLEQALLDLGFSSARYQKHSSQKVEDCFLHLLRGAYKAGNLNDEVIRKGINKKYIRSDIFSLL